MFKNLIIAPNKKFPFIHFIYGDKIYDYEFAEASDTVKQLAKLSIEDLAKERVDAEVVKDLAKCIIIDHILTTRLFKIQSNASWGAGILALLGVLLGLLAQKF